MKKNTNDETDMKLLNELKVAVQSQNVQCQTLGLQYYNMIETLRSMSEKVDKLIDNSNSTKDSIFNKIEELSSNISTIVNKPVTDGKLIERINKLEENLTERINAMNDIIKARQDDLYDVYPENEEDFDKINYDETSCIQNTFNDQTQLPSLSFPSSQLSFSPSIPFQQFGGLFNQVSQSNPMPVYSMALNPNVNITSSDILPTGPPVSQPPLSVIIPTHHILSSSIIKSDAQPSYNFKFNSQQTNNQSQSVISHGMPSIQSTAPLISLPQITETFSFQPTFKESFEASLNKSRNSATDDSYTEEHDPIPEFQPIIPLPDKIEETTGEENDIILFERRAKLYKYVEKEWKEKGIGILKILKNNDTNKVRLVMRREQVHKVCANHFLYDNMELKSKSDKAVLWSANDFSDAVKVQVESLCARFKTVEDCDEFIRVFNENKQPCSQNTSLVENSNTSDNYESIIETNKDSCLTLSSENEKSLKHELGGFTFSAPPIINEISTPKQEDKTPEKPKNLFSNLSFPTPHGETKVDSKDKPSFSFNFSGVFSNNSTPKSKPTDLLKSELFSNDTTPKLTDTSLFTFNKTEEKSPMSTPKLDLTSTTSATSYFSTLAKSSPNIGFTNSPDFKGFPGAGSTIFSVKTNPSPHAIIKSPVDTNNDSTSKSNNESEDFVPTAEFTPVIALPEKVDIVTGEEGLEVIFDDRAKLLRFESKTKEWKEKGVGQMKILYNSKDGFYQLLMRRELVFKVCCNQRLSADLELKPMASSDKAVSWIGQDFSEGESIPELFALRFKTVDQLKVFKDKVNEVKSKIIEPKNASNIVKTALVETHSSELNSKTLPKLNDLSQFKPKPGSWTCDTCYVTNDANIVKCVACCTLKPGAVDNQATENKSSTGFTFGQTTFPSLFKTGDTTFNSVPAIPFVMPKFGVSSDVSFSSLSTCSNTNTTIVQKSPLTWREESSGLVKYDSEKSDEGTDESDNDSDGYDEQKTVVENGKNQFSFSNSMFKIKLYLYFCTS